MHFYASFLRPLLFQIPHETVHACFSTVLHHFPTLIPPLTWQQPTPLMGLTFPNPLGLAAGLDKHGLCLPAWHRMGFGSVEIGGVTPHPQPGNPLPRIFRLPKAQALINRMGFNSVGMHQVAHNIHHKPEGLMVGINMAKNKDTPLTKAYHDYQAILDTLYPFADYFTLNISSPNTENLRQLQQSKHLQALLMPLKEQLARLNQRSGIFKPLAIKIAPDLNEQDIQTLLNDCIQCGIDGIVATNTTLSRQGVEGLPNAQETGGLSGEPLFTRSTHVLALLKKYKGNHPIDLIGVGGILTPQDAKAKFKAGAAAIQIYTGLIYHGPGFIQDIVLGLSGYLTNRGNL